MDKELTDTDEDKLNIDRLYQEFSCIQNLSRTMQTAG